MVQLKCKYTSETLLKHKLLHALDDEENGFFMVMSMVGIIAIWLYIHEHGFQARDFFAEFLSKPLYWLVLGFPIIVGSKFIKVYREHIREFRPHEILEMDFDISQYGITVTNGGSLNLRWEAIDRIEESRSVFMIYVNEEQYFLLLKEDIDKTQLMAIRNLMLFRLGKKKTRLKMK